MRFSTTIALATALLGASTPIHAQGLLATSGKVLGCNVVNQYDGFSTPAPSAATSASCVNPGKYSGSSFASFDRGILHATADMSFSNFGYADGAQHCNASMFCSSRADAYAYASWTERARVTNSMASTLRVAFHLSGSQSAQFTSSTAPCGMLSVGSPFAVSTANGLFQFGTGAGRHSTANASCIGGSAPAGPYAHTYSNTYFVDVPILSGAAEFTYFLYASLGISFWSPMTTGTISGSASSDFLHTAGVTGFGVFDAAGNDISAQSTVEFESGLQLMTTAPEPGSLALVGLGALSLFGVANRRKAKAKV